MESFINDLEPSSYGNETESNAHNESVNEPEKPSKKSGNESGNE